MIAWNEAGIIETAIASAKKLAYEVVVVDTGSEDDTVEIAKRLGCTVLEGGDRMHKANARNQAIKACSGDYIFILDCDEIIESPEKLRQHLLSTDADAVYVRIQAGNQSWHQMRAWRKGTYWYQYRAHEVPIGNGRAEYTDFVIDHRQPPDRWSWKKDYTLDRLLLDVEENPEAARPHYYLGRQYLYLGDTEDAAIHLREYLELAPGGWDAPHAYIDLAVCEPESRVEWLWKAAQTQPQNRYSWYLLAQEYHNTNRHEVATACLQFALAIQHEYGYAKTSESDIHDLLARSLWKQARYHEGLVHANKALELCPGDDRLIKNREFFVEKVFIQGTPT